MRRVVHQQTFAVVPCTRFSAAFARLVERAIVRLRSRWSLGLQCHPCKRLARASNHARSSHDALIRTCQLASNLAARWAREIARTSRRAHRQSPISLEQLVVTQGAHTWAPLKEMLWVYLGDLSLLAVLMPGLGCFMCRLHEKIHL